MLFNRSTPCCVQYLNKNLNGVRGASLDRAGHPAVLKGQRGGHKEKVEDKHGHAQHLGHLPAGHQDAHEHEAEHREEHDNGAAQARARHLHRCYEHACVEEPGQGQPGWGQKGGVNRAGAGSSIGNR